MAVAVWIQAVATVLLGFATLALVRITRELVRSSDRNADIAISSLRPSLDVDWTVVRELNRRNVTVFGAIRETAPGVSTRVESVSTSCVQLPHGGDPTKSVSRGLHPNLRGGSTVAYRFAISLAVDTTRWLSLGQEASELASITADIVVQPAGFPDSERWRYELLVKFTDPGQVDVDVLSVSIHDVSSEPQGANEIQRARDYARLPLGW